MRSPIFASLLACFVAAPLLASDYPTVKQPLSDLSVAQGGGLPTIDLRNHFEITGIQQTVVQFRCVLGAFNLEMRPDAAPISVTNFLRYINEGKLVNHAVHRSDTNLGVIQGGEFTVTTTNMDRVPTYTSIPLEYNLPNERGTIAMARTSAPDSATCQYFINTSNNTVNLGAWNGGGYAVFGRVTGSGMSVVDAIATVPTYRWGAYPTWPLIGWAGGTNDVFYTNIIAMSVAQVVPIFPTTNGEPAVASFSVTNTNPSLLTAAIEGSLLRLTPKPGQSGGALITVTATDINGNATQDSFQVELCGYSLGSQVIQIGKSGGAGNFSITTGTGCPWTASSSASWLFTHSSGSGSGTVYYEVQPNSGGFRTGTINVGGLTCTVVQAGRYVSSDFSNDGLDDLVFQNSLGQLVGWRMNGTGKPTTGWTIYSGELGAWRVAAIADLNRDGQADLILQSTAGAVFGWIMKTNGIPLSGVSIYDGNLAGWTVATAADVNGDGVPDLIWQSTTGALVAWLMDGSGHPSSSLTIYNGAVPGWKMVAAGDLNGDGIPDLVWQTPSGSVAGWLMDGHGTPTTGVTIYGGTLAGWRIAAMRDVNSDGIPDLIWQSTAGAVLAWQMSGRGIPVTAINIYPSSMSDWLVH